MVEAKKRTCESVRAREEAYAGASEKMSEGKNTCEGRGAYENRTVCKGQDICESQKTCDATTAQKSSAQTLPFMGIEKRLYEGILQPFASHVHDYYVVGLVLKGARRLECNSKSYEIRDGDIILFNPGDVHGCEQADEGRFSYVSYVIPANVLSGVSLQGPVVSSGCARRQFLKFSQMIEMAKSQNEAIVALEELKRMFGSCDLNSAGVGEMADDKTAPQGLGEPHGLGQPGEADESRKLCEASEPGEPGQPSDKNRHNRQAALRTQRCFRNNCAQNYSLGQLAECEGTSKYALIRAYRKAFHITPGQHLISLRVDHARDLLASGLPPSQVALTAGFADQAHLTRAFKARLGFTPALYQRMLLKDRLQ